MDWILRQIEQRENDVHDVWFDGLRIGPGNTIRGGRWRTARCWGGRGGLARTRGERPADRAGQQYEE